ncbi:hypothetical protein C7H19_13610 [Aphanothece hegewaldii CCALA 016]|uniref:Glycosyltransferase 2-like domain-containing protein n=1 Tax=Aphanothece hegewaldii CCALA 016 TaxID=2107694 RepID=A0A2T1LWG8_9CHRO|nr:hypothetical protein [Aphanothece hegewaldii]PSF36239.1 hypothetical protein C7H19_13610 [Aphanothece hegewaldii CCALA 016]
MILLSILIPTLESRKNQYERLYQKLSQQISAHSLIDKVEILQFLDNQENSIGFKRNKLIQSAKGKFIAFVDDDDDVSDNYIPLICCILKENPNIDCIGIKGLITFAGKKPKVFIHSLQYQKYFSQNGIYYRPPYHLNPIKREIARQYLFEDISYSEDVDWAMRICQNQALQTEYFIDQVIYYYDSRRFWFYQELLDRTEPLRHTLGLQLANRIKVQRWLKSLLFYRVN